MMFIYSSSAHRQLHSFPPRRSPDLAEPVPRRARRTRARVSRHSLSACTAGVCSSAGRSRFGRSEAHTSELQSRFELVFRLLLEKKKKSITNLLMQLLHTRQAVGISR